MKFLWDYQGSDDFDHFIKENAETGERDAFIKGIYIQADQPNKNRRFYPNEYVEREVAKAQTTITENRMLGNLDHPNHPEMKLEDAAFMITSLKPDPSKPTNYIGEGKIMKNTPKGKIAFGLAQEGVKFGVSSRAVGSVTPRNGLNYVNSDLKLITVDLVSNPSAPDAFVQTIYESEWLVEDGKIFEDEYYSTVNKIKSMKVQEVNKAIVEIFSDYIGKIR